MGPRSRAVRHRPSMASPCSWRLCSLLTPIFDLQIAAEVMYEVTFSAPTKDGSVIGLLEPAYRQERGRGRVHRRHRHEGTAGLRGEPPRTGVSLHPSTTPPSPSPLVTGPRAPITSKLLCLKATFRSPPSLPPSAPTRTSVSAS